MPQIIYCMHFKGTGLPSGPGGFKVTSSATSNHLDTTVDERGVSAAFHPAEGGMAYFESEVKVGDDGFLESGTIAFGETEHSLNFSTVGKGQMAPSPDPKVMAGTVVWRVDGGEGQFEGATGLITSNFLFTDAGEVTDYHFGVIFVK